MRIFLSLVVLLGGLLVARELVLGSSESFHPRFRGAKIISEQSIVALREPQALTARVPAAPNLRPAKSRAERLMCEPFRSPGKTNSLSPSIALRKKGGCPRAQRHAMCIAVLCSTPWDGQDRRC